MTVSDFERPDLKRREFQSKRFASSGSFLPLHKIGFRKQNLTSAEIQFDPVPPALRFDKTEYEAILFFSFLDRFQRDAGTDDPAGRSEGSCPEAVIYLNPVVQEAPRS